MAVVNFSGAKSTPDFRGASTFVTHPTLHLYCYEDAHVPKKTKHQRERSATSVGQKVLKDIALLTDDAHHAIFKQMKDTKRTSVSPFFNFSNNKERYKAFLSYICSRYVWIVLSHKSLQNSTYSKLAKDIIEKKQIESGSENTASYLYGVRALLIGGLKVKDIPEELKGLRCVMVKESGETNLCEVLEGQPGRDVETIKERLDTRGPFLKTYITPMLDADNSMPYLKRTYETLIEVLDDTSSYPRQHLMHLYKMPNVCLVKDKCDESKHRVCVECRPVRVSEFIQFLNAWQDKSLADVLRDSLKINGQSYIGIIDVEIAVDDIHHALTHLLPGIQNLDVKKTLETCDMKRLEKIVEPLVSDAQVTIPTLKGLAATLLYETCINSSETTPYTYLREMKRRGCPPMLDLIRTKNGYNAMHLAIIHERAEFLKMLFYQNIWEHLRQGIVEPYAGGPQVQNCTHVGYTPRRLAEALSFKTTGVELLQDWGKYDSLWLHLPPLSKACLAGRLDYVSKIVDSQPDLLQRKDDNGSNCLFYACTSGNASVVEYLIKQSAPRNIFNNEGETVLHLSAMLGLKGILKVLGKFHFDIRGKRNKHGYCAADYCAMSGDVETLQMYKEKKFPIGPNALTVAVKSKQLAVTEYLLTEAYRGTGLDINSGRDKDKRLAIHYAAITGSTRTMELLLEKGADICKEDRFHKNVIHLAADHEQIKVADLILYHVNAASKALLDKLLQGRDLFMGKDLVYIVRGKDRGRKAWHWVELRRLCVQAFKNAMASGQIDVASYGRILKSGFGSGPDSQTTKAMEERTEKLLNPDDGEPIPDMTPLHIATLKNNEAFVIKLLDWGAQPNVGDYISATPMHYAAMLGNTQIMSLLEKRGGSLDAVTKDGRTPLDVAEENAQAAVINFIKAKQMMKWAEEFIERPIQVTRKQLSKESLGDLREKGEDVRAHAVDTLRDLNIEINMFLEKLGSGPVQEASMDSGTSAVDHVAFPHPVTMVTGAGAAQADNED